MALRLAEAKWLGSLLQMGLALWPDPPRVKAGCVAFAAAEPGILQSSAPRRLPTAEEKWTIVWQSTVGRRACARSVERPITGNATIV